MDSGRSVPVTNTIYCILILESNEWWADDASDFDMSSDDSEDEDSLCNTVMLTGPHWCRQNCLCVCFGTGIRVQGWLVFSLMHILPFDVNYTFRERDFIFGMYNPLMKPFQMIPELMNL